MAAALAGCVFSLYTILSGGGDASMDPLSSMHAPPSPPSPPQSLWDIADPIPLLDGGVLHLREWRGTPALIVNTASNCGFTQSNYAGLSALHAAYGPRLHVLGFPCAQFGGQEFDDARDTRAAASRAGVTFPLAARVEVKGERKHPVFKFLDQANSVKWNFEKWLIGRDGTVIARFGSDFDEAAIKAAIERELASAP
jgi:glutathione peroxidase